MRPKINIFYHHFENDFLEGSQYPVKHPCNTHSPSTNVGPGVHVPEGIERNITKRSGSGAPSPDEWALSYYRVNALVPPIFNHYLNDQFDIIPLRWPALFPSPALPLPLSAPNHLL